jgi:hypothetical protein
MEISELTNLQIGLVSEGQIIRLKLVSKDGKNTVYNGSAPYMIVILNGAKRQNLESFTSTLASSEILKKFYGASDQQSEVTTDLQSAMTLYNDMNYNLKGQKVKNQMTGLDASSSDYQKLKTLYNAYSANIQSPNFKLPSI